MRAEAEQNLELGVHCDGYSEGRVLALFALIFDFQTGQGRRRSFNAIGERLRAFVRISIQCESLWPNHSLQSHPK